MRLDPIVIEEYDAAWPASYRSRAVVLEPLIGPQLVVPLEHIGSTAIPGMPAKPIIDMLAVISDYDPFIDVVPRLEQVGWVHAPEPGDDVRRRWSLCLPTVERRTHHLHVVEHASDGWRDWLLFRDHLRTHPEDAERYAALKVTLSQADPGDRSRYRAGKAPLIAEILDRARRER
ncbi:GrpB family protein [Nocardioides sp. BGMRC 2183]|nr:GrpB family protein [Nocardioides sp. BGMRC 2183]